MIVFSGTSHDSIGNSSTCWHACARPISCAILQALHEEYADQGLVIVGVNIDNSRKKMDKFLRGTPVTFRLVHDPKTSIAQRYEPPTMPTSYFIARDGKIRYLHEGFRKKDAEGIKAKIRKLLAEGGG